jgi:TonB family protein
MKLVAPVLFVLALLSGPQPTSSEDRAQLVLISAGLPMYPLVARVAHMTGTVEASFVVDANGNVLSVEILSGPNLLGNLAQKNILTWKFEGPGDPSHEPWKDQSTFVYKLTGDSADTLAVKMNSYRHVEIDAPAVTIQ